MILELQYRTNNETRKEEWNVEMIEGKTERRE
jgi:hypothetical protein